MSHFISFTTQIFTSILRLGIVSGITLFVLITIINGITPTSLGELNLVLIVGVFTFFPIFLPLFFELFFLFQRMEKKKRAKANSTYRKL